MRVKFKYKTSKLFLMKKIAQAALGFLLLIGVSTEIQAQENNQQCTEKYNLFRGDFKAKKYDMAYTNWLWCMDNCPTLSVNIYKNGADIAEKRYANAPEADKATELALVNRVFEQRIKHFPKDLGRVYGDWASFMAKVPNQEERTFELLELAFSADPTRMGSKNIYKYFDIVLTKNQDTDVQKVFDTYDDVVDGVEKQRSAYTAKIDAINKKEEKGQTLSSKDVENIKIYQKGI